MTGLCKSPIQQRTRLNLSPLRCCDEILGEKGGVTLDITPLGKNGATPIARNPCDPYHSYNWLRKHSKLVWNEAGATDI